MSTNDESNNIFYVDFPIQVASGSDSENLIYRNILLRKLPDGNFAFDPNEIFVENEIVLEDSENRTNSEHELTNFNSDSVKKYRPDTSENNTEAHTSNVETSFINNVIEISHNASVLEERISPKSHIFVDGKPGVRYYQNKKLAVRKGPGRPRKDGTVKPRTERIGPFKCSFCNAEFDVYTMLRKHERQHLEERAYQCSICMASFNLMSNYRLHMATHESGAHRCPECHKTFNRLASLRAHLMLHCVDDNPACLNCGASFQTQALLNQHKKICSEGKYSPEAELLPQHNSSPYHAKRTFPKIRRGSLKLNCHMCSKGFKKPSQLERHYRIHTGEKPFKCQICDRAFSQKGSLIIHRIKHTGNRPYSCSLCPATFAQKGNLRSHQKTVHGQKNECSKRNFACQKCSCVFLRLGSLNCHMNKMHPAIPATIVNNPLSEINSVMSQLAELQNMTMERDILQQALNNSGLDRKNSISPPVLPKPIETIEHGQANLSVSPNPSINNITVFDNSYGDTMRSYVVKQRKVGGVKWRQCNFCTREFKKPSDLVRHLRIHTKEKPFRCPQCSRRFTVKSTLTAHLKTHAGEKNYPCSVCRNAFSSASSLNIHARLHTGAKPFKCQICEKSFRTSGMLQTHRITKCGKVPLQKPVDNMVDNGIVIELEEPIIITKSGLVQPEARLMNVYGGATDTRPYSCDRCTAAFKKLCHLKQHQCVHSEDRPFKCPQCDKSFNHKNVLKAHIRTHSGLRPYKCSISHCFASFGTAGSLKRHSERHSEHKNYMCPYCQKTFKTKVNCRMHMKIHKTDVTSQLRSTFFSVDETPPVENNINTSNTVESTNTEPIPTHFVIASNTNVFNIEGDNKGTQTNNTKINEEMLVENLNSQVNINLLTNTVEPVHNYITFRKRDNTMNTSNIQISENIILNNAHELNESILKNNSEKSLHNNIIIDNVLLQENIGVDKGSTNNIDGYNLLNGNFLISNLGNQRGMFTLLATNDSQHSLFVAPNSLNQNQLTLQTIDSGNLYVTNDISTENQFASIIGNNGQYAIAQNCNNLVINNTLANHDLNSEILQNAIDKTSSETYTPVVDSSSLELMNKYFINLPKNTNYANVEQDQNIVLGLLHDKVNLVKDHQSHFSTENNLGTCNRSQLILSLDKTMDSGSIDNVHIDQDASSDVEKLPPNFTYNSAESNDSVYNQCEDSQHIKDVVLDDHSAAAIICEASETNMDNLMENKLQSYEVDYSTEQDEDGIATYLEIQDNTTNHEGFDSDSEQKCIRGKSKSITLSEQAFLEYVYKQSNEAASSNTIEHPNKCNYCVKSFKKPSDLTRHIRTHTGEKPYSCSICHKSFSLKTSLDCHMITHNKTMHKSIVCNVCNSSFSTKGSLKVHMRLHTGSRPFKCPLCDMSFRTSGHKKAHLLVHYRGAFREGKDPKDIVTRGNKVLQIMTSLTDNLDDPSSSIQDQEETNQLSHCTNDLRDTISENESAHHENISRDHFISTSFQVVKMESDYASYPIELGSDSASDAVQSSPPSKKRVQRKLNRQYCTICGKSFMKPSQLARHQLIHTGEKPFQCDICSKAFNQKNALSTHMRHHTGVRPHECPFCGKTFTQKGNLKTHISRTHDSSQYDKGKHQTSQDEKQDTDITHDFSAFATSQYLLHQNHL